MSSVNGSKRKVLVTGAAGAVGQAVMAALRERGHEIRAMDLRETPGVEGAMVGTVADAAAVRRAVAGMDTVIHLAATIDDADFMTELLPNNIVGVYNVLEAAREAGVKRVVLASTVQTVNGYHRKHAVSLISPTEAEPTNAYGVTKLFAEDLGKMYARRHGMSVICARLGFMPRNVTTAMEFVARPGIKSIYLSHADAGRFFVRAVEAEGVAYAVLWVLSRREKETGLDMGPTREVLGFEPQDFFPEGLPWKVPGVTEAIPGVE